MAGTSLVWDLIAVDRASPGFNSAATSADRAAAATDRLSAAQRRVGASSAESAAASKKAGGVLLAGAVAIGASVKSALDYNSALGKMQAQARLTNNQVQQFSKSFMATSNATGVSASDIATAFGHAYAALQKLGLKGPQAMNAVKTAAEGARMSGADFEDTLSSLDALMVAGYASSKNLSGGMGALNGIVASGHMSMEDLNAAISSGLLPAAKAGGVSLHELGAGLAVFGDMGVRGAKAGTQMRMVIQDLEKPAASAGPALQSVGLSMTSLSDTLQKHGLLAALQQLSDHMTQAGITGSKMGTFLLDAFTKKAGTGIATLLEHMGPLKQALDDVTNRSNTFDKTWQTFSQTPAQRLAQLGQQFKNLGISIGNEALPLLLKIGNALSSVLSFVQSHSSVFQPLAAGVLAFAAAVKIAAVVSNFTSKLSLMASQALTTGRALKSAFVGAAIGASIGMVTKNASGAEQAMGALTSAAGGAAAGLAVGGPWGAAIGGGIGLISDLATTFGGASKASQQFAADEKAVTDAIIANSGAISDNIRVGVAKTLNDQGLLDTARHIGVSMSLMVDAATSVPGAMAQVGAAFTKAHDAGKITDAQFAAFTFGLKQLDLGANLAAVSTGKKLATAAARSGNAAKDAAKSYGGYGSAIAHASEAMGRTGSTVQSVSIGLHHQSQAADDTARSLQKLNSQFQAFIDKELGAKDAQLGFREALLTMKSQLADGSKSLADNTAKGVANRQMLVGLAQQASDAAHNTADASHGTVTYTQALRDNMANLIAHAHDIGLNTTQVHNLFGALHLLPKDVPINVHADNVPSLQTEFNSLTNTLKTLEGNHVVSFTVFTKTGTVSGHARGGSVPDGLSVVGEEGPELVMKRGNRVDVMSNPASRRFVDATGMAVPGFAKGTISADQIGRTKSWIHAQNPKAYTMDAAGPSEWDCSGLVGGAIKELFGQNPVGRILSTSDEGAVLPNYGFKAGAGNGKGFVVGWENDSNLQHTTGMLDGLKFEAFGDRGVPLGRQIRVGGTARDPRTFPNVMHIDLAHADGKPGGDGSPRGGPGAHNGPTKKQQRHTQHVQALRQARYDFESSQHPHKILMRHGHAYFGGQEYDTRALAEEAKREAQVTSAQNKAQAQRQAQRAALQSLRGGIGSFIGALGGSVGAERKAFRGLLPDIRKLGGDDKFISRIEEQNKRLDNAMHARNKIEKALEKTKAALARTIQARNSLESSVRSSLGFSIAGAGTNATNSGVSAGAMLAQEKQQLTLINKWSAGIIKLHKMGLSGPMLSQLASAGTASWPQVNALLHASPKVFREIMRDQRRINATAKDIANRVGKDVYGDRVHDEKQRRERERRRERHAEHRVERLAKKIGDEIGKEFEKLHIKVVIDKKGMARVVRDGEKQSHRDGHHVK